MFATIGSLRAVDVAEERGQWAPIVRMGKPSISGDSAGRSGRLIGRTGDRATPYINFMRRNVPNKRSDQGYEAMNNDPYLEELQGRWIRVNGQMLGDSIEKEIARKIESDLEYVKSGDWEKLYRDKRTGEYWELDYPCSEMHGGGPLRLCRLRSDFVRDKYGLD